MQNKRHPRPLLSSMLAVVLLAGLSGAGCGKAGAPLPPLRKNPQQVTDVQLAQHGRQVEISYRVPRETLDGLPLPVLEIQVRWAAQPGELKKIGIVHSRQAAPGEILTDVLSPTPEVGAPVQAYVIAVAGRSPSAPSSLATLSVVTPPPAPTALEALADGGARLSWRLPLDPTSAPSPTPAPTVAPTPAATTSATVLAPALSPSPTPVPGPTPLPGGLLGFRVYRRTATGSWTPLFDSPTTSLSSVDGSAKEGDTWCYVVRAVLSVKPLVESGDSNEACLSAAAATGKTELPALKDDEVK